MTSEEKMLNGDDVSAVASGQLADAIETWLAACATKELEPRATCTTTSVTLKAGDRAWVLEATPESIKTAMAPFKSDARFTRAGVKRNGYTSCMYLLNHPRDIPYVANGHTRGTAQTASNTGTVTLGSVDKAQRAIEKAQEKIDALNVKLNDAKGDYNKALDALDIAIAAEKVKKLEDAKIADAKNAKMLEDAKLNRAALIAKSEKLAKQLADMQKLLDASAEVVAA
jgi:hypothetical protein